MLRPFKLTYASNSVRQLMTPWLRSLREMAATFLVLVFVLLLFAMFTSNKFKGDLNFRCRLTPAPVNGYWEIDEDITRLCSAYGYGSYECPAGRYCGSPDMYDIPMSHENTSSTEMTFYGATGFDSVGLAFLACFQVVTYDDWAKFMYRIEDADDSIVSRIVFPVMVFIGSFFCLNLIVAVVVGTFQQFRGEQQEKTTIAAVPSIEQGGEKFSGERQDSFMVVNSGMIMKMPQSARGDVLQSKPSMRSVTRVSRLGTTRLNLGRWEAESAIGCFRRLCIDIKHHFLYRPCIIVLVLGNLLIQALDRKGASDGERVAIDAVDVALVSLFLVEMLLCMVASGFKKYFNNRYNVADLVINLMGIAEVALTYSSVGNSKSIAHIMRW